MDNSNKKILVDIGIIRPIIISFLVIYHSFIIYIGGWKQPVNFVPIGEYYWIAKFSYSFMLQMFVLLSGYIYAYQIIDLNKKYTFRNLFISKTKRLILPSILFSIVYVICFNPYNGITNIIIKILSGAGHMWFLPMLFWCFIVGYVIEKSKFNDLAKLCFCSFLTFFSLNIIPFGLGLMFKYLFFFYLGFIIYKYKKTLLHHNSSLLITSLIFLYLICFIYVQQLDTSPNINNKILLELIKKISILLYTTAGCISMYLITNKILARAKNDNKIIQLILYFNPYCFGIYLFQQFILQYLYYHTTLPNSISPYWLPWISFIITIISSYILTKITLKFKIGKLLIG